jgi:hypothetical protein
MKKVFGFIALVLLLAACTKEDIDLDGITITATLAPKTADTKAVADGGDQIAVTWAQHEHMAILYEVGGTKYMADAEITAVDGSGAATIEFTVESGTPDDTPCQLVYPLSAAKDDHSGVKDAATLLSAQDGTLNARLDVRVGEGKIRVSTPGLDVTTQPAAQFALFKFTVKNSAGSATISVKSLTVTIGSQNYVITPSSATSELYVALPAVSGQTVSFSATGSDNKPYACAKGGVSFAAGNYYRSTLKMYNVTTVTWDPCYMYVEPEDYTSYHSDGITVDIYDFYSDIHDDQWHVAPHEDILFIAPLGNLISKIEINYYEWYSDDAFPSGDWSNPEDGKLVWQGTPVACVAMHNDDDGWYVSFACDSIVFTILY